MRNSIGVFAGNTEEFYIRAMVLKLFIAADPFHCTQNCCGPLHFVNIVSITEKLDLITSWGEHLNRPGKKQISGFGLPPIAVIKIKYKRSVAT